MTRIYFPGDVGADGRCTLAPAQAHHVARVLRLEPGEAVTLFDGRGYEFTAFILQAGKSGVTLDVREPRRVDRESPVSVTLAQAVSSGERMDFTVQKAVELGAACIQPIASARAVVRLQADRAQKRIAHWQAVSVSACEQCGRNIVPRVMPIVELNAWLATISENESSESLLMLSPDGSVALRDLPRPRGAVVLLAGPEGGFSDAEEQSAKAAGFAAVRLGPRILRTETAAVAALAAMQTLWGDY